MPLITQVSLALYKKARPKVGGWGRVKVETYRWWAPTCADQRKRLVTEIYHTLLAEGGCRSPHLSSLHKWPYRNLSRAPYSCGNAPSCVRQGAIVMGFGFRKLLQLEPGLRASLSRRGAGLSLGVKGFIHSVGLGRRRTTISASGKGLAYSTDHHRRQSGGIDSAISGLIVLVTISVWILGWPPLSG